MGAIRTLLPLLALLPSICLAGANFGQRDVRPLAETLVGKWKYEYQSDTDAYELKETGTAHYFVDGTGYFAYNARENYTAGALILSCEMRAKIRFIWSVSGDEVTETTTEYEVVEFVSGNCGPKYDELKADPSLAIGWSWVSKVKSRSATRLELVEIKQSGHATTVLTRD